MVCKLQTYILSSIPFIVVPLKLRKEIDEFVLQEVDIFESKQRRQPKPPCRSHCRKSPSILSDQLTADDWNIIERYMNLLKPIKEATLASTLQRLLLDVSHVGADVEWQPGGTGGVTLLIPGVSLSGR